MLSKVLPALLLSVLAAGGAAAAVPLTSLRAAAAPIDIADFAFDETNPEALAWAESESAALITEISAETRAAIRLIITQMFAESITPREGARMIAPMIGLTTRGVEAVFHLRETLTDPANYGRRVYAGKVPIRIPRSGLPADRLERVLTRYSQRLINLRAFTIARTETIRAANEGQRLLWVQAQAEGLLPTSGLQRIWVVTPDDRLCSICSGLEDDIAVGLDGLFSNGTSGPPAHPNCRCVTSLVTVRQEKRA